MEVQDVPAIVAAAHANGVIVALDNTWSAGLLFDAFAHGVDITMQAITKYIGGHATCCWARSPFAKRRSTEDSARHAR